MSLNEAGVVLSGVRIFYKGGFVDNMPQIAYNGAWKGHAP